MDVTYRPTVDVSVTYRPTTNLPSKQEVWQESRDQVQLESSAVCVPRSLSGGCPPPPGSNYTGHPSTSNLGQVKCQHTKHEFLLILQVFRRSLLLIRKIKCRECPLIQANNKHNISQLTSFQSPNIEARLQTRQSCQRESGQDPLPQQSYHRLQIFLGYVVQEIRYQP